MSRGKTHYYKSLKIWQLGIEIDDETFSIVENSPNKERFDLSSQMIRCSNSIPSNIAEGSSRTNKSFSHFLDISLGSAFELGKHLILASNRS
jgi:four helix bundle protein